MSAGARPEPVPVAADVLTALDLPPAALARWLNDVDAFCHAHGGPRRYPELLALVAGARASLVAQQPPAGRGRR